MSIERILADPELVEQIARRLAEVRRGDPGVPSLPPDRVREAADAVRRGEESTLSADEEAIIRREGRPVYFVQQDRIDGPHDPYWKARVAPARERLEAVIPSVGRIDLERHAHAWVGTAWLVAQDVVMTNRHVARLFATAAAGGFVLDVDPYGQHVSASIDFRGEHRSRARIRFPVSRVLHIEPVGPDRPDVALLKIERSGEQDEPQPSPVRIAETDAAPGAVVAVLGYPAWDDRNDPWVQEAVFGGVYGVKRFQPGEVTASKAAWLNHDCSTLGGNSGSVVVAFDTGCAVGLHFMGEYERENFAVKASTLAELLHGLRIGPRAA